jgi:hypothetical protein
VISEVRRTTVGEQCCNNVTTMLQQCYNNVTTMLKQCCCSHWKESSGVVFFCTRGPLNLRLVVNRVCCYLCRIVSCSCRSCERCRQSIKKP